MTRKQQDKRAYEMYALYTQGYSLEQVGKAYGVTRQSVYGVFKDRGFSLREKKQLPYIVWNGNKYTLTTDGYYRRTDGNRELLHRDIWAFNYGEIPVGYDVHHKDENKSNNAVDNLELLTTEDHTRLHNPLTETPKRYCLHCGKELVRAVRRANGELETPSALAKRKYCSNECKHAAQIGKPRGLKQ